MGGRGSGSSRGSAQHDFSFASWGKIGSCGSLSRRRQRWKLTHQLWVESQTRIKDAQTVRFRSQSCHLFRLSLQRLLTRSRSCYFSFAAGGGKEEATPHGLSDSMISASLQWGKRKRLLTRSRSCYFSFAAGGKRGSDSSRAQHRHDFSHAL